MACQSPEGRCGVAPAASTWDRPTWGMGRTCRHAAFARPSIARSTCRASYTIDNSACTPSGEGSATASTSVPSTFHSAPPALAIPSRGCLQGQPGGILGERSDLSSRAALCQ